MREKSNMNKFEQFFLCVLCLSLVSTQNLDPLAVDDIVASIFSNVTTRKTPTVENVGDRRDVAGINDLIDMLFVNHSTPTNTQPELTPEPSTMTSILPSIPSRVEEQEEQEQEQEGEVCVDFYSFQ